MAKKKKSNDLVTQKAVFNTRPAPRVGSDTYQWCPLEQDFVPRHKVARRGIHLSRRDLAATERLVEEAGFQMEIYTDGHERVVKIKDRLGESVCWISMADMLSADQYKKAVKRAMDFLLDQDIM